MAFAIPKLTGFRPNLADLVDRQLPEFVREDYETFVAFVRAYYEYVDSQPGKNLEEYKDLDKTLDEFVKYFRNELYPGAFTPQGINERFVLEQIKNAHLAKGSEAAYKLLFRLLFGKEVQVDYPGLQMLRASDGRWNQELSVFARVDYGVADDVVGKLVDITAGGRVIRVLVDRKEQLLGEVERVVRIGGQYQVNGTAPINSHTITVSDGSNVRIGQSVSGNGIDSGTKVTAVLGNVVTIDKHTILTLNNSQIIFTNEIYEFYLDKKFYGIISPGDKIKYSDTFQATVLPATQKLKVIQGGKNFRVGQVFELQSGNGTGSLMKVTGVDKANNNGIKYAEFIKFGIGYESDFALSVLSTNSVTTTGPGDILTSSSSRSGNNLYINDRLLGFSEQGYVNNSNYTAYGYWDGTYAGTVVREFTLNYRNAQTDADEPAIIVISLGAMVRYPGYYTANNGFLDDSIFIQDSRFYQSFSYVIRIDERLNSYKSIVKSLIHPAGMALFGEYSITNTFDLSLALESLVKALGIGLEDEQSVVDGNLILEITKMLADSIDHVSDSVPNFSISKPLTDNISEPSDSFTQTFTKNINISTGFTDDYVTALEGSLVLNTTKSLTDSYSGMLDTTYTFNISKALTDSIAGTDSFVHTTTKYVTDSTDGFAYSGTVGLNPYAGQDYFSETYNVLSGSLITN